MPVSYGGQSNVKALDVAFSIHTDVDSRFYDAKYPDYEWPEILLPEQVTSNINAGATDYAYQTRDIHGAAAFIGNGPNSNIPMVGQSTGAVSVPLAVSAVGFRITNEDARQYTFGFNADLADTLGKAGRKACENLVETSIIFGNAALGFKPWINYPGITRFNAPAGAGGGTAWAGKTPEEILADINHLLNTQWEGTKKLFLGTDIYLPMSNYSLIVEKPMVIGGVGVAQSILSYMQANNLASKVKGRELRFFPSRYLADAGAGGAARMILMDRDAEYQALPWPMDYTLNQPVPEPLAAAWYAEQKFGSYHVRQPGSMLYMDGI
jgi:hypothetical protein